MKNALAKLSILPVLVALGLMAGVASSQAQEAFGGTDIGKPQFFGEGAACDASLLPWRHVWYGHFSGGLAHYQRGAPGVDILWEDRKLCFPSRRQCLAWHRAEFRQFHRVRGYWTCMPLR